MPLYGFTCMLLLYLSIMYSVLFLQSLCMCANWVLFLYVLVVCCEINMHIDLQC